jgi:hypothetical protein
MTKRWVAAWAPELVKQAASEKTIDVDGGWYHHRDGC